MVRFTTRLLRFLLVAYLGICGLLWMFQGRLVWIPGGVPTADPSGMGWAFENVLLQPEEDVALSAWFLPVEEARGAVLISHGNAGNMTNRLPLAGAFRDMGLSVLMYDYRGYGASGGSPSEEGTYQDAHAAFEHLVEVRGLEAKRVLLYGESLGAAVTVELATKVPAAAVILESGFTSLPDAGADVYPWLPVRLLARIHYASIDKIERIGAPLFVIHSPDDEVVAIGHGERLFEKARAPKRFLRTAGGHNGGGFRRRAEWLDVVRAFVDGALE